MILPSAAMVNQIEAIAGLVRSTLNILGIDFTYDRESLIGLGVEFYHEFLHRTAKSLSSALLKTEFHAWLCGYRAGSTDRAFGIFSSSLRYSFALWRTFAPVLIFCWRNLIDSAYFIPSLPLPLGKTATGDLKIFIFLIFWFSIIEKH